MDNFQLVADDDPRRCQAVTVKGQCHQISIEGGRTCMMHGGNKVLEAKEKNSLRNYRLGIYAARLQQLGDSPNIKSIRDEVAILRLLMEERLNTVKDNMDLIYQSGPISDLVLKIEKLVTSCHKLEAATGSLLDKQAIVAFGTDLIQLLSEEIHDEALLAKISERITATITKTVACDVGDDTDL